MSEKILRSIGLLRTNALDGAFGKGRIFLPTFSFLSHSCLNNAKHVLSADGKKIRSPIDRTFFADPISVGRVKTNIRPSLKAHFGAIYARNKILSHNFGMTQTQNYAKIPLIHLVVLNWVHARSYKKFLCKFMLYQKLWSLLYLLPYFVTKPVRSWEKVAFAQ